MDRLKYFETSTAEKFRKPSLAIEASIGNLCSTARGQLNSQGYHKYEQ